MRCRHGEGGKFTESQSATPIGGMELAYEGVTEQQDVGRSMVLGKMRLLYPPISSGRGRGSRP